MYVVRHQDVRVHSAFVFRGELAEQRKVEHAIGIGEETRRFVVPTLDDVQGKPVKA